MAPLTAVKPRRRAKAPGLSWKLVRFGGVRGKCWPSRRKGGLATDCPVTRTSPIAAPVYDVMRSFMLTALTDGRRFSHIECLREDPTIPELFWMEAVVSDDTVRRSLKSVDPVMGAE
jgi:hypothetical protein